MWKDEEGWMSLRRLIRAISVKRLLMYVDDSSLSDLSPV